MQLKNDGMVDALVELFERKDRFSRAQMQKEQRRRSVASLAQLHDGATEPIEEHELAWSVRGQTLIKPGGQLDIVVSFTPNVAGRYCGMLEVGVKGGAPEFIQYKADVSVLAQAQCAFGWAVWGESRVAFGAARFTPLLGLQVMSPNVCVVETMLDLGEIFEGVTITRSLTLKNLTMLDTHYVWEPPLPRGAMDVKHSFSVEPQIGTIRGGETEEVTFTFDPQEAGVVDIVLGCDVQHMLMPVGCRVVANVLGLRISYIISDVPPARTLISDPVAEAAARKMQRLRENAAFGVMGSAARVNIVARLLGSSVLDQQVGRLR
jgi:hypothetical protein